MEAYHDALARCAELEGERQKLWQMKSDVMQTIARFSPLADYADSQSDRDIAECDEDQVAACGQEPAWMQERVSPTWNQYQDVLAAQDQLEDEVELLAETLTSVANSISCLSQKSYDLSDHLQSVQ